MVEQEPASEPLIHGGGVLQYDAQVVGQLGVVKDEARSQVRLFEPQQGHPAPAGVAVDEVGEEEGVAPPSVEGLHVLLLRLRQ